MAGRGPVHGFHLLDGANRACHGLGGCVGHSAKWPKEMPKSRQLVNRVLGHLLTVPGAETCAGWPAHICTMVQTGLGEAGRQLVTVPGADSYGWLHVPYPLVPPNPGL